MIHYITSKGELFAFEDDGSQDHLIAEDMRPATDEEVRAIQSTKLSPVHLWANFQASAQDALDKSDITLMRCFENGVALPQAWVDYRKALREIVSSKTGDASQALPTRPAFPAGT